MNLALFGFVDIPTAISLYCLDKCDCWRVLYSFAISLGSIKSVLVSSWHDCQKTNSRNPPLKGVSIHNGSESSSYTVMNGSADTHRLL